MRNVWRIARREFKGYFDHATAYILIVAFLALSLFLAFRTLYAVGAADFRALFDLFPWLLAVFIPAITMRSLAEERGRGTLEWLMSQPLTEAELVVGKCLGNWLFALVALAGTLPATVGVLLISDAAWGPLLAQYVGAALLALLFVGIGLFASAATRNQITAFILGAAVSFALVLVGLQIVLVGIPTAVSDVVTRLAVVPHYESVARGVLDLRDVLYFLSTAALFLVLAWFLLLRLRLSPSRGAYSRLRVGTAALGVGVVTLNLLGGEIHGRIDLTEDDLYTLSEGTRTILEELDDVVTIRLFVSSELPSEITMTRRDVRDLLDDYRRFSDGNVRVEIANPDESPEMAEEARSYGIQQIQFNVLRQDEFQVRQGWFGLAILHAGEQETIPYIQQSDDLEYRLTSAISSMTAERMPRIGFVGGFGARTPSRLPQLEDALSDRFEVTEISLEGDTVPSLSPGELDVLALAGPSQQLSEAAVDSIGAYLDAGGSALFLLDRVVVDPQNPVTVPLATGLEQILADRGARVEADLVADYQSNQTVQMGRQGGFSLVRAYPLWPVALPEDHSTTRQLESMTFPWASPVQITDTTRARPLWTTTEFGDQMPAGTSIQPDAIPEPDPDALSRRVLAAAVEPPGPEGDGEESGSDGRLILVGDADFLEPQFLQGSPQSLTFAVNAVDWLAQDESLIAIRSKDRTPPPLVFESDLQRLALRWGNLVGVPALFVLVGLGRAVQRRSEAERLWQEVRR